MGKTEKKGRLHPFGPVIPAHIPFFGRTGTGNIVSYFHKKIKRRLSGIASPRIFFLLFLGFPHCPHTAPSPSGGKDRPEHTRNVCVNEKSYAGVIHVFARVINMESYPQKIPPEEILSSGGQNIDKFDALPSKVCKQSFDGKHPFAIKLHFQAIQPGNAHFIANG